MPEPEGQDFITADAWTVAGSDTPEGEFQSFLAVLLWSSPLSFFRTHWDHESVRPRARPRPRSRATQSRTRRRTTTRTIGRFLESLLSFFACIGTLDPDLYKQLNDERNPKPEYRKALS